jgi:hypothetical protein
MPESKLRQGLIRMTGLDKIIRDQMAMQREVGGISTAFSPTDDLVGDLALIEETLSQFNMITRMHRERKMRYRDYEAMDNYGDVSVALDIYSEEATQNDIVKDTNLWATGDNEVVAILEDLFSKQRFHTMITGFSRQIAKYGDLFLAVRYDVEGIKNILFLPPDYVSRIGPGVDKVKFYKLENQLQRVSPRNDGMLLPWECVHFRLLSFGFSTIYGRALIEPARKRWLHLKLLEDAVAIYRLNRAVERLIFYIDVGAASPTEALRIVNQYKRKFGNKRSYIDPSKGEFEQQYDPHNMLENIFWPVNSSTERSRIEKLDPPGDQGQLQDLDHFNDKLFIALGIPRDFITGETSGGWNSRESLALQDVRFSRKLHKLQLAVLEGVEQLCRFHLAVVWGDADKAANANFELHLADVSKIARQQYDQVLLNRVQMLTMLNDLGLQMNFNRDVWVTWALENYFPDLPKELIPQVVIPDKFLASASQDIAQAQAPVGQPAAAPKKKPAAKKSAAKKPTTKKKTTKEEFRDIIFSDLKRKQLTEKTGPILLDEDIAVIQEAVAEYSENNNGFSTSTSEIPPVSRYRLKQLVEAQSSDYAEKYLEKIKK